MSNGLENVHGELVVLNNLNLHILTDGLPSWYVAASSWPGGQVAIGFKQMSDKNILGTY
jgi:hypothetical protein